MHNVNPKPKDSFGHCISKELQFIVLLSLSVRCAKLKKVQPHDRKAHFTSVINKTEIIFASVKGSALVLALRPQRFNKLNVSSKRFLPFL